MLENSEIEESVLKGAYQGYSWTIFWNLLNLSMCFQFDNYLYLFACSLLFSCSVVSNALQLHGL